MSDSQAVFSRMTTLVAQWEAVRDRRAIFLGCYRLMTRNMLDAIEEGRFHDGAWVSRLLERFAAYYFAALDRYDRDEIPSPVWQLAFDATRDKEVTTLQHLLLGVNAHINHDLVFSLYDLLEPEWAALTPEQKAARHADHEMVNRIIGETTDAVQDQVVELFSPWVEFFDKMLGPVDEWLTSQMISHWREDVWDNAVRYLELTTPEDREALRAHIVQQAMNLGNEMLRIRS